MAYQHVKKAVSPLSDSFGRFHSYLRMSLTEKCNLRCQYCMPLQGVDLTPRPNLLTLPERKLILELFYEMGVTKFRFTGGEPTLSNQLVDLVSTVRNFQSRTSSSSSGTKSRSTIGITTNGTLLSAGYLRDLRDAGLDSINISLDTLNATKFASITRRDSQRLNNVLSSIYTSLSLGLKVKVNCVLMKGTNEDELPSFVQLSREMPLDVRFIELMPFEGNEWSRAKFISYTDALLSLRGAGYDLQAIPIRQNTPTQTNKILDNKDDVTLSPTADEHDTTKWYQIAGHGGRVGFITSMTDAFCTGCNRLRITADGRLKVCLFGEESLSLRDQIRSLPSQKSRETDATAISPNSHADRATLHECLTSSEVQAVSDAIGAAVRRKEAKLGGKSSPEDIASSAGRPMILIGG